MDGGTDNQLFAESSATYTSTSQPVYQLVVQAQARFRIAQPYIDLASALSDAVPPIAPAVEEIMLSVVKNSDIATRINVQEAGTELSTTTVEIERAETEQFKTSLQAIANDCRNMLMKHLEEPLRQAQMSFNTTYWLVPGFLIIGMAIILIGFIFALVTRNLIIAVPTTIGGGIIEAIGIVRSLNKESNDRLGSNTKFLIALTQFISAGEYIDKIENAEIRDQSYANLAKEIAEFNKQYLR
jgi:hypothetical protein